VLVSLESAAGGFVRSLSLWPDAPSFEPGAADWPAMPDL
jgi:hypothetical protein